MTRSLSLLLKCLLPGRLCRPGRLPGLLLGFSAGASVAAITVRVMGSASGSILVRGCFLAFLCLGRLCRCFLLGLWCGTTVVNGTSVIGSVVGGSVWGLNVVLGTKSLSCFGVLDSLTLADSEGTNLSVVGSGLNVVENWGRNVVENWGRNGS